MEVDGNNYIFPFKPIICICICKLITVVMIFILLKSEYIFKRVLFHESLTKGTFIVDD